MNSTIIQVISSEFYKNKYSLLNTLDFNTPQN